MGNCWPKPVDDLPSTNNIKPTTIGTGKNFSFHHLITQLFDSTVLIYISFLLFWVQDNAQSTKNKIINTGKSSSSPSPADLGGEGGGGGDGDGQIVPPSGQIIGPNLKLYTFAELKRATRNFRPDTLLGEGGFGRVFKGWIDNNTYSPSRVGVGIPVAVKKSNPDSAQGLKEWQVNTSIDRLDIVPFWTL